MEGKSVKSGMSVYELDLCCAGQGEAPKMDEKGKGVYVCSCCGSRLFSTEAEYPYDEKYPRIPEVLEFVGVLAKENVVFVDENAYGIERVSFACQKCGLNMGFVASREENAVIYCANPSCLRFVTEEEDLSKLNEKKTKAWTPAVSIIEEEVKKGEKEGAKKENDNDKAEKKEENKKREGGEKEATKKKSKKVKREERKDEEDRVSIPKVAAAFAGLLSVIGWAGYATYK